MKNNLTDEKIIKMIKEDYESVNPSSELKKKIKYSYQNYHTPKNNVKNNIIINLLQMIQINKTALGIGALVVAMVGGMTFYLLQNGNEKLAIKDIDLINIDEKVDNEADEIISDLDKDSDDLTLLAQSEEDDSTPNKNNNSDTDLDDINIDDLNDALDGLDEIDSILDEDVFGDDLF